jgi:hypothetical protein
MTMPAPLPADWPPKVVTPPPAPRPQRVFDVEVICPGERPDRYFQATETHVTRSDTLVIVDHRSGERVLMAQGTWDECKSVQREVDDAAPVE